MILHAATCTLAAIIASACARSGDASFLGGPGPDTGVAASSGSDSGPGNQDSGGSSSGISGTSGTGAYSGRLDRSYRLDLTGRSGPSDRSEATAG